MPCRELFGFRSVGRLVLSVLVLVNLSPVVVSQVSQRSFGSQPRRLVEAARFTYEVVIVRKSRPTARVIAGIDDQPHSGSFSANHEFVTKLIQDAYGVDSAHVMGGPPWANSDYFDIQAKSSAWVNDQLTKLDDDTAKFNKQHMLQILLADKFKLRVHVVTEEVMAYSLVGAKTGPRLSTLNHASFETGQPLQS